MDFYEGTGNQEAKIVILDVSSGKKISKKIGNFKVVKASWCPESKQIILLTSNRGFVVLPGEDIERKPKVILSKKKVIEILRTISNESREHF